MHQAVHDYIEGHRVRSVLPPDPFNADLWVMRTGSVYTVLPFTDRGYDFLVAHHTAGVVDGDSLRVYRRQLFPFINALLDSVLDEGLKVV